MYVEDKSVELSGGEHKEVSFTVVVELKLLGAKEKYLREYGIIEKAKYALIQTKKEKRKGD